MDDATRRLVERDLAAVLPFTEIAARHGVTLVDFALIHHRMPPPTRRVARTDPRRALE